MPSTAAKVDDDSVANAVPQTNETRVIKDMPDPFDLIAKRTILNKVFKSFDHPTGKLVILNNWIIKAEDGNTKERCEISTYDDVYTDLEFNVLAMPFNGFVWITNYELTTYKERIYIKATIGNSLQVVASAAEHYKGEMPVPVMVVGQFEMEKQRDPDANYMIVGEARLNPPGVFGPFKATETIKVSHLAWKGNAPKAVGQFLPESLKNNELTERIDAGDCAYFVLGYFIKAPRQNCSLMNQGLFDSIVETHHIMHTECPRQKHVVPPNIYRKYDIYLNDVVTNKGRRQADQEHRIIIHYDSDSD